MGAREEVSAMTRIMSANYTRASVVGALAIASIAACGVLPARAGDDGSAPIWVGIGSVFGLGNPGPQPDIDYRERSKLVVPPSADLPPPGKATTAAGWPVDEETIRLQKEKAEADHPGRMPDSRHPLSPAQSISYVETTATSGYGPGGGSCLQDGKPIACPQSATKDPQAKPSTFTWNPLAWVGIQKKPAVVLQAPGDREELTDPPKDLREPAEGVGAKVDTQ